MAKPNYESEEKQRTLEDIIPSPIKTPEEIVEKISNFENLSNEAKFVVSIVLNTPVELFQLITTNTGMITKNSVRGFLETKWPTFIVNHVMVELRKWVNGFKE